MSFFLKWLKAETTAHIGLRPHRLVELPVDFDTAYGRVLHAIEVTLGANVYIDDRNGRFIEAGFGLVNNERVRVSFETESAFATCVRVEAYFPAGAKIPKKSAAVDVLADTLEAGITA